MRRVDRSIMPCEAAGPPTASCGATEPVGADRQAVDDGRVTGIPRPSPPARSGPTRHRRHPLPPAHRANCSRYAATGPTPYEPQKPIPPGTPYPALSDNRTWPPTERLRSRTVMHPPGKAGGRRRGRGCEELCISSRIDSGARSTQPIRGPAAPLKALLRRSCLARPPRARTDRAASADGEQEP